METTPRPILGLVPAAGRSSRMGEFKPLLPFRGRPLIVNAVGSLLSGGAERAVVVTGLRAAEVEAALENAFGDRVRCVRNLDYARTDMLRSIQLGCAALEEAEALFLLPGDMPAVRPATLRALLDSRPAEAPYILFPVLDGRRRHPPLIHRTLLPEIASFRGDGGLRALWRLHESIIREVPVADEGVALDLDTPGDYQTLINTFDTAERS